MKNLTFSTLLIIFFIVISNKSESQANTQPLTEELEKMASKKDYLVKEGDLAPNFKLKNHRGEIIELDKLRGKYVVLYFYPKDDTPGCTIEAKGFQSLIREFDRKNSIVLGVSPDSGESHCAFAEKYNLTFHLLTDEDHKVAEVYGAWGEKNMYGKKSYGIIRSTFLISPEGKVIKAWRKVNPDGHAEEVLATIPEEK